jgi:hypothetical protein
MTAHDTGRADPLAFLADEVAALRERHLYRRLRVMSSAQGPIVSVLLSAAASPAASGTTIKAPIATL